MKKKHLSNIVRDVRKSMKKHSPEILTGTGIAGMLVTTVMAVKATPKALMLLEDKKDECEKDTLTTVETIKTTWKCYIPSAIIGSISILCLVGASSVSLRRNAVLATAYTLSETALKDYKEKVVETIGEKKEQAIRESIAEDKVTKTQTREVILTDKGGHTKCYDVITDRYFESDKNLIERAVNELNRQMRDETYVSLNDFYYEIGLNPSKMGDMLGWNIDRGYINIEYSSCLDADGTPCLVLDYTVAPVYDYM